MRLLQEPAWPAAARWRIETPVLQQQLQDDGQYFFATSKQHYVPPLHNPQQNNIMPPLCTTHTKTTLCPPSGEQIASKVVNAVPCCTGCVLLSRAMLRQSRIARQACNLRSSTTQEGIKG